MSTKSSNSTDPKAAKTQERIAALFSFSTIDEEIEADAYVLMAQFLSEAQIAADKQGINRKSLAKEVGTSASYLTQLFRGHKLMNLTMAAKLQKALGFEYKIGSNQASFEAEKFNEVFISKMVSLNSNQRSVLNRKAQFIDFQHDEFSKEQISSLNPLKPLQAS